jgi:predicted permease
MLWRAATWWLGRRLPAHELAPVSGDLIEEYRRDRAARGRLRAEWRFGADTLAVGRAYRRGGWMGALLAESRLAIRHAARQPGVTVAVAATLAFAVAANTALFSIVDGLFLRPLPFPDPGALVRLRVSESSSATDQVATYLQLIRETEASPLLVGAAFSGGTDAFDAEPDTIADLGLVSSGVSADFFRVLGVQPILGRAVDDSDSPDADPLPVVLGHGVWRSVFGSDPAIAGSVVPLAGRRVAVLGVMPAGFDHPRGANIWVPAGPAIGTTPTGALTYTRFWDLARLGRGVSIEQFRGRFPDLDVEPLREAIKPDEAGALLFLLGATGLFLLAAWVQVGALMLARATTRAAEIGVRLALGAGRLRLLSQFGAEGAVLALGALAAAWVATPVLTTFIARQLPEAMTAGQRIDPDVRTFLFASAVSVAGVLLLTLVPMDVLRRAAPVVLLRGGTATSRAGTDRIRAALLVAQLACTTLLLCLAGLALHSNLRVNRVDVGFEQDCVWQFRLPGLAANLSGAERDAARERRRAAVDETLLALRALPGVVAAGAASSPPLSSWGRYVVRRPGRPQFEESLVPINSVTPGYFGALGVRLVEGHTFDEPVYRGDAGVAVVNEALARELVAAGPVIGQTIGATSEWRVVGIVADVIDGAPGQVREPQLLVPLTRPNLAVIVVRAAAGDGAAESAASAAIAAVLERHWGAFAPRRFQPLSAEVAALTAPWRARSILFGLVAALCLPLAVVGLAGAMQNAVRSRHREIAIRLALGAGASRVRRAIVSQALLYAGLGVAIGIAGGIGAGVLMASQLFEVQPVDARTIAGVTAGMLVVAWLAAWMPARRAAGIAPAVALKDG